MTQAERDYLYINHPEVLRGLDRGSRSSREWYDCNWSAINDQLKYGCGPTREQVEERKRFDRENEGSAGW